MKESESMAESAESIPEPEPATTGTSDPPSSEVEATPADTPAPAEEAPVPEPEPVAEPAPAVVSEEVTEVTTTEVVDPAGEDAAATTGQTLVEEKDLGENECVRTEFQVEEVEITKEEE